MEQKVEVRFTICFDEQETWKKEQKERKQLPKKYLETQKTFS